MNYEYKIQIWQKGIYRPWKWSVTRISDETVMTGTAWSYQGAYDISFAAYKVWANNE